MSKFFKQLKLKMSGASSSSQNASPDLPPLDPEIRNWFFTVDQDHSGQINHQELQAALVNSRGRRFSDSVCKLMIEMFDGDGSSTIDVGEFQLLFGYINQWMTVFKYYDKDESGFIEEQELSQALLQMGYRFSPSFIKLLMSKYDLQNQKEISVDGFIEICVQIQRLTDAFRIRDAEMKGSIALTYEDFLNIALNSLTI